MEPLINNISNALMGRGWPPQARDLEEAEAVCRALGLGPLLERMPAGLQQPVGETGCQLSQGERSRLYIARALLRGADLVILDESLAALDPETLHQALGCVLARAGMLMVKVKTHVKTGGFSWGDRLNRCETCRR